MFILFANFLDPTFIPCPTSIPESRVSCLIVNLIIWELKFCKIVQLFCVSLSLTGQNLRKSERIERISFHKIWTLECHANGHPKPKIKWLREDKGNFTVYDRNNKRMIGKHVRAGIKRDSTVLPYMKCIKTIHIGFEGRARKTTLAVHLRNALW